MPAGSGRPAWRVRGPAGHERVEHGSRGVRRALSVAARAVHVTSAAVVVGGVVLDAGDVGTSAWLAVALASGVLLLALEVSDAPELLTQVRGLSIVAKLLLLGALPLVPSLQPALITMLFFAVVATSHAPSSIRHRGLWR